MTMEVFDIAIVILILQAKRCCLEATGICVLSDVEIEKIAAAVVRRLAQAELDRLLDELALEEQQALAEAEAARLSTLAAFRARRLRWVKLATILMLAVIYVLMFEAV